MQVSGELCLSQRGQPMLGRHGRSVPGIAQEQQEASAAAAECEGVNQEMRSHGVQPRSWIAGRPRGDVGFTVGIALGRVAMLKAQCGWVGKQLESHGCDPGGKRLR